MNQKSFPVFLINLFQPHPTVLLFITKIVPFKKKIIKTNKKKIKLKIKHSKLKVKKR